jgi:hypothetical protein
MGLHACLGIFTMQTKRVYIIICSPTEHLVREDLCKCRKRSIEHLAVLLWACVSDCTGLRTSTQFTVEIESDSTIPFLDVPVIGKGTFTTDVYRTHPPAPHWLISKLQIQ